MTLDEKIQKIDAYTTRMLAFVEGRQSHWSTHLQVEGEQERSRTLADCAIADAQEVVKLSAAIVALRAML